MPYFRGQAVGDDYLQGLLAQYRQQNPGAAADDQSILDVLEGRAQPNWATGGAAGAPGGPGTPGVPWGLPPGVTLPPGWGTPTPYNLMGRAGGGGMTPLSALGGMAGGLGGAGGGLFGGNPLAPYMARLDPATRAQVQQQQAWQQQLEAQGGGSVTPIVGPTKYYDANRQPVTPPWAQAGAQPGQAWQTGAGGFGPVYTAGQMMPLTGLLAPQGARFPGLRY